MKIAARDYRTSQPIELEIDGETISGIRPMPKADTDSSVSLPWVAPGFVDIQINGYLGQEFSALDLTPERVADIARAQAVAGVTRFCPTVTTADFDTLDHAMRSIAAAGQRWPDIDRRVLGIHLEGPYISSEDGPRGAHPLEHCRPPNWEEFARLQDAAGGRIRLVTLSAEFDGSPDFIARAVASGVRVAIGHTGANSDQIRAAVDAGASLSTHLGNGAHRLLRRHPNYIWDQLAEDRLMASLIVDGHHLPPAVVKTFVRAKTPERIVLVSDLSGLAGLPAGVYQTSLCDLEILADGRLVIAGQDQLLAGASRPIGDGVANVMQFAGIDLATAVDMAALRPARLLGSPVFELQTGNRADLVLFHLEIETDDRTTPRLTVLRTLLAGECVYQTAS